MCSTGSTYDYEDPNDTSSDSDDEVLRRYQQSMVSRPLSQQNLCQSGNGGGGGMTPRLSLSETAAKSYQSCQDSGRPSLKAGRRMRSI